MACADDFPTDRYVVDGIARARGCDVRWLGRVDEAPAHLDDQVAVMVASAAHFETAALADIGGLTAAVHDAGGLVLWDCSHAGGAVPLDLDATTSTWRSDARTSTCTADPALRRGPTWPSAISTTLRQPIQGWFGQRDQFAMGPDYVPASGMTAWRCGTPGMFGLEVAATGIAVVAEAGIDAVRAKSLALGQ